METKKLSVTHDTEERHINMRKNNYSCEVVVLGVGVGMVLLLANAIMGI